MAKKKQAAVAQKTRKKDVARAGDISPADYNPRNISAEQLETLKRTMQEFGDISGIVFNTRTGNTVGGHQRLKHLDPTWVVKKRSAKDKTGTVALGEIETPWGAFSYREVDWPLEKEQAANLAANQSGGEFDYDAVARLLQGLDGKFDLSLTAFDEDEIGELLKRVTELPAPLTPFSEFSDANEDSSVKFSFGDYDAQVPKDVYELFKQRVEKAKKKDASVLVADILQEAFE